MLIYLLICFISDPAHVSTILLCKDQPRGHACCGILALKRPQVPKLWGRLLELGSKRASGGEFKRGEFIEELYEAFEGVVESYIPGM